MITVQDSWTTPQSSVQAVNINVSTATLYVLSNLDQNLLVNRAANRALYAAGGVPPYTFQITWGSLPAGLTLDANSGKITGVPTTVGTTFLTAQVKDSVGSTSTAEDTDYYKFDTMAGSVVNISTNGYGTGPIDTVIEVLDANGFRLSTCHFPDDQAGTYTSSCINDEASSTGHNSALDYQMPGSAPSVGTVYVHVLDWRGDARPDMQYILNVNGITAPMIVQLGAVRGVPYTYTFGYVPNAYGTTTWSLDKGTMPDGLAISSAGLISGTPTTDGTYSFGLKILDSATPPKTLYALVTMVVAEPVIITSTATLPTACLGKAYSFQVQATGGVAPLMYWSNPGYWPSLSINQSTGVLSGTPSLVGTFPGRITVSDLGGNSDSQIATLTVQNCP